jgi:hypothetical protein
MKFELEIKKKHEKLSYLEAKKATTIGEMNGKIAYIIHVVQYFIY